MDWICIVLGGWVVEEIIFGKVFLGVLDDFEKVIKQVYIMVVYYGFNEKLGNVSYYDSMGQSEQFL